MAFGQAENDFPFVTFHFSVFIRRLQIRLKCNAGVYPFSISFSFTPGFSLVSAEAAKQKTV
jgi:hypothetical protein